MQQISSNSIALKKCNRCGLEKPGDINNFVPNKQCKGGLQPWCKPCRNAYGTDWRGKNRPRIRARRVELYKIRTAPIEAAQRLERIALAPIRSAAKRLMGAMRDRCKLRGLPRASELCSADFIERWLRRQLNCECCGVLFNYGPKNKIACDASASFDQIVPGAGYLLDNVALICWRCNNIKRNYSPSDLRMVAEWVERRGDEVDKFPAIAA